MYIYISKILTQHIKINGGNQALLIRVASIGARKGAVNIINHNHKCQNLLKLHRC